MRVRRTPSLAWSHSELLTRSRLGGLCSAILLIASARCAVVPEPKQLIRVTVENQSTELLDRVELIFIDMGEHSIGVQQLGAVAPGGSIETLVEGDQPRRIDVQVWGGHCPARSSGPFISAGMDYRAVVKSVRTIQSVTTDVECFTRFTIDGRLSVAETA